MSTFAFIILCYNYDASIAMMLLVISLMRLLRWGAVIPSIQFFLQQRFCLCVVELLDKLYSHQFLGEEVVCFNWWETWLKPVSCIQPLFKFCEIMSHMEGIIDYCRCSTWFQRHKESCMPSNGIFLLSSAWGFPHPCHSIYVWSWQVFTDWKHWKAVTRGEFSGSQISIILERSNANWFDLFNRIVF